MFKKSFKTRGTVVALISTMLVLLLVICSAPAQVFAAGRYDPLRDDITRQLILSCVPDPAGSEGTVSAETDTLLRELRNIDPEYSRIWEQILSCWESVNQDGFVNAASQISQDFIGISGAGDELTSEDSLCITILGFALNPDGSMKDELISRLQTGLKLAEQYPDSYVLVTGGATAKNAPEATEADCMAKWLKDNGLHDNRIIIENSSKTTVENALFSNEILKADYPQIKNMVIVTSDYHVPLGCLLFQSAFLLDQYEAPASRVEYTGVQVISNCGVHIDNIPPFSVKIQADKLLELAVLSGKSINR